MSRIENGRRRDAALPGRRPTVHGVNRPILSYIQCIGGLEVEGGEEVRVDHDIARVL